MLPRVGRAKDLPMGSWPPASRSSAWSREAGRQAYQAGDEVEVGVCNGGGGVVVDLGQATVALVVGALRGSRRTSPAAGWRRGDSSNLGEVVGLNGRAVRRTFAVIGERLSLSGIIGSSMDSAT